ncbi:PepSY domain-containing protein [Caulobacter sp.]|uniref:PepSY domain-containing protein n=1 Tax=Caulobacter sp. TaxID=78 RepID=UPI001B2CC611|nr:PepSY domain-containing protein [Caulobacter sp.]MBO9545686.1 PepSY domain-containing protein [Caulobacter sp.]
MKTIRVLLVTAALIAALPGAASAQRRGPDSLGADWRAQSDQARGGVQSGRLVPLARVIDMIGRRVPGRVLDAGLEGRNWRVRWAAADGRRIDFIVDAETGQIISGG